MGITIPTSMGITIPTRIAGFRGQCIESVQVGYDDVHIHCRRDKRFGMPGSGSGNPGILNRWLHRVVEDPPHSLASAHLFILSMS